jgi:diguanylate cyclase (GGDEF)-like protein
VHISRKNGFVVCMLSPNARRGEVPLLHNEPLDSFMDYAPMPIGILDKRLRFVKVNRAMAKVHKLPAKAHLGKAVAEVLPGLAKQIRPFLSKVLTTGEPAVTTISGNVPAYSSAPHGWLAACFPCGESQIALMALKGTERGVREILDRSAQQLRIALAEAQQTLLTSEMAHSLHSAATTEELCRAVERFAPRLFPGNSGSLWVLDSSRKVIERAATWGSRPKAERQQTVDACFALRLDREHMTRDPQSSRVCAHDSASNDYPQICLPLAIQSARLGVLHLRGRTSPSEPFTQNEMRLFRGVGAEIALALANSQMRESLRQQAFRDPLTGLYNRRFLHEALELELRQAKRKGWPVGLVMIDIDNFKSFNDTYGHTAGDSLLQNIAESLQSSVRSNDVLCRYGGDEFCLVMPEASLKDVVLWADRRRSAAKSPVFVWEGKTLPVPTVSIGAAAYPACLTSDALFRAADAALYAAKAQGRDQLRLKS